MWIWNGIDPNVLWSKFPHEYRLLTKGTRMPLDIHKNVWLRCVSMNWYQRLTTTVSLGPKRVNYIPLCLLMLVVHGCVKSTVIQRRQHQLGRMADFLPPVTFSVFELIKSWDHWISIYGSVLKCSFYTPVKRHNPIKTLLTWCDLDIPLCLQFYEFQRSLNIFVLIQYSEFWVKWTQWNVNPMQAPPLPSPVI